jgi:hypothetical protein
LEIGTSFQLVSPFFNNIGLEEMVNVEWASSDTSIIEVDNTGLAFAKAKGFSIITATYSDSIVSYSDAISITVGQSTVVSSGTKSGTIRTTSSYVLQGSFEIEETAKGINIKIADNYRASASLPRLYLYLSNNQNIVRDALEIGPVRVFSGAHNYEVDGVGLADYRYLFYYCNVSFG